MHEILTSIKTFITNELQINNNEISVNDDLFDIGLDSMGIIKLVTFLEQEFNINVDANDLNYEHFNTIKNISDLVKALMQ